MSKLQLIKMKTL